MFVGKKTRDVDVPVIDFRKIYIRDVDIWENEFGILADYPEAFPAKFFRGRVKIPKMPTDFQWWG